MKNLATCISTVSFVLLLFASPCAAADAISQPVDTKPIRTMCCSYNCCNCSCVGAKRALAKMGFYKKTPAKQCK